MPKSRRVPFAANLILLVVLIAVLVACRDQKAAPPAPISPTIPPVITRIVTPLPTSTPLPPPTLAYDVLSVEGRWIVRFDLEIDNVTSDQGLNVQQLAYSGAAELQVGLDGTVTGSGHFSPTISNPPCDARVLDTQPLTFTLSGSTYPNGDQVGIQVAIQPDSPDAPENYTLMCPNFNDVRRFSQPVLWPVFQALTGWNWGTASFQGLTWNFPLQSDQTYDFTADVNQDTSGKFGGTLIGEVRINRG
jgi:hypothetical protein